LARSTAADRRPGDRVIVARCQLPPIFPFGPALSVWLDGASRLAGAAPVVPGDMPLPDMPLPDIPPDELPGA
jgi:hypothetical protein